MNQTQIGFVDESSFEKEVMGSSVPTVVDFYADWCGPCRTVAPILEDLSDEYSGSVRFVKVDIDRSEKLAERYQVTSIPTVMIFSGGKPAYVIVGATSREHYKKSIERALGPGSGAVSS